MMFVQKQNFGSNSRLQFNFHLNSYDYPAHIHQFAECCYVIDGNIDVSVNGRTFRLGAGEFLFIAPLQVHRYRTPERCDVVVMAFPTSLVPELSSVNLCAAGSSDTCTSKAAADYFESLFLLGGLGVEPIQYAPSECGSRGKANFIDLDDTHQLMRVRSSLCALFAESTESEFSPTEDTDALAKLLMWLESHYTEPITLADAAKSLGYSPNYLSHRIKKLSGMSFPDILSNLRVEYSLNLLLRGMTVLDAALESGFETERSFYRVFRKVTGTTPGEYLKGKTS